MKIFDLIAAHKAGDIAATRAIADLYCNSHQYDAKTVKAFAAFWKALPVAERETELMDALRYQQDKNGPIDEWAGWIAWFNRVGDKINKVIQAGMQK